MCVGVLTACTDFSPQKPKPAAGVRAGRQATSRQGLREERTLG